MGTVKILSYPEMQHNNLSQATSFPGCQKNDTLQELGLWVKFNDWKLDS